MNTNNTPGAAPSQALQQPADPSSEDKVPTTHEICEHFLGTVVWNGDTGFCRCPGEHLHSHSTGRRDCKVYLTGSVPTVTCFHDKCRDKVGEANKAIRDVWGLYQPELPEEVMAEVRKRAAHRRALIERAEIAKPLIFRDYTWTVEQIAAVPGYAKLREYDQEFNWQTFLRLFDEPDNIWVGDTEDSGRPHNAASFRRKVIWEHQNLPPGPFTCPSVFRRDCWSRSNANVISSPYLVVECDDMIGGVVTDSDKLRNKDACGSLFRYLQEGLNLKLRMVVDTGNKSLHGWFDMPEAKVFEELKIVLPVWGADRATLKPSQPVRVPGWMRQVGDRRVLQSILYFDPK